MLQANGIPRPFELSRFGTPAALLARMTNFMTISLDSLQAVTGGQMDPDAIAQQFRDLRPMSPAQASQLYFDAQMTQSQSICEANQKDLRSRYPAYAGALMCGFKPNP